MRYASEIIQKTLILSSLTRREKEICVYNFHVLMVKQYDYPFLYKNESNDCCRNFHYAAVQKNDMPHPSLDRAYQQ